MASLSFKSSLQLSVTRPKRSSQLMPSGSSRLLVSEMMARWISFTCWIECITSISIVMELCFLAKTPGSKKTCYSFRRCVKMASGPVPTQSVAAGNYFLVLWRTLRKFWPCLLRQDRPTRSSLWGDKSSGRGNNLSKQQKVPFTRHASNTNKNKNTIENNCR